jgi:MFS family permease
MGGMIGVGILNGGYNVLAFIIISQIFPEGKTALYYGLFNVSVTASQVIGAFALSPIYSYLFQGNATYMLYLGAGLVLASAVLWVREDRIKVAANAAGN